MAAELDYQYLAGVVGNAQKGNCDAFAELYAATYQKQYLFSCHYLNDPYLAQDALQETYILALRKLNELKDPKLFVSWLNQINFRVCYNMHKKLMQQAETSGAGENLKNQVNAREDSGEPIIRSDEKEYIMQQILALPFSESQVIFLHYLRGMKLDQIAYVMDISKSAAKHYLNSGRDRLGKVLQM